jgi:hypothetical protein
MCPACLATISMIVAGALSTGGVTALAAKTLLRKMAPESHSVRVRSGEEFRSLEEKEKKS